MTSKLKILDLFSGIGGFSLGLERAGMQTVAFCEINPFCRKVLAKHWPEVPIYDDIRTLTAERLRADGISVDVVCGGFPCPDISVAGKGAGLDGERSGLFFEAARIVRELRPRVVVLENVAALLGRGLGRVLGALAEIGHDAWWDCIPASAVGSPQLRDRIWIVAMPRGERIEGFIEQALPWLRALPWRENERRAADWRNRPDLHSPWLCRTSDAIPDRVDRTFALGNAVVPQIPELIGRAILNHLEAA